VILHYEAVLNGNVERLEVLSEKYQVSPVHCWGKQNIHWFRNNSGSKVLGGTTESNEGWSLLG
jgi:hypothetical protein